MPELYQLASIVLAVPAMQVSVERAFSSLKFILAPQRSNISEDTLEDMTVCCNMPYMEDCLTFPFLCVCD